MSSTLTSGPVALDLNWPTPSKKRQAATGRVLHVINGEHYSGAERVQDLLGMTLPQLGFEVGFVCLKQGKFAAQRQAKNCPLDTVPMSSKLDRAAVRKVAAAAHTGGYDIVHAHTPRSLVVANAVARKLRLPLVYHVHSPVGRDSTRSWHNTINRWVENWSLRKCSAMICVSKSVRNYMLEAGHPPSRLHVVHNGVAQINQLADRRHPQQAWTLGTTALFRPRKGTELLLQALATLRDRNYQVNLLAVGPFETPEYEAQIKGMASELGLNGIIDWAGFQSDVPAYFNQMDLFVLPSLFGEGLPMVVLEAMANGVPVVAADVEGVREAVRDRIDGLIFQPGDADALIHAAETMIRGEIDWEAIRHSAWQRQCNQFSDLSMATGVAQVYQTLMTK